MTCRMAEPSANRSHSTTRFAAAAGKPLESLSQCLLKLAGRQGHRQRRSDLSGFGIPSYSNPRGVNAQRMSDPRLYTTTSPQIHSIAAAIA